MAPAHLIGDTRHSAWPGVCAILLAAALTAACSSGGGLFADSDLDNTVLPGKRISVAKTDQQITADPEAMYLPVVVPPPFTNADWPQPGGFASNAPQHLALAPRLRRLWRVSVGEGSSSEGQLSASPIVVGGRIFAIDTVATVHALNAQNGKRLWKVSLALKNEDEEEGYGGGVASDGARVYATTGFGTVVALDPAAGKVIWKKQLDVPVRAAPTVAEGRIYVTTINNEVFGISTIDGSVVWRFSGIAESAGVLVNTSPAVASGKVVVPYTSGDIIAFNSGDGRPLWNDNLTRTGRLSALESISNIGGRPVIHRGNVYAIAHGGRLAAIKLDSGERLWSRDISGVQTPWAAGDYLYVVAEDNLILAVAAAEGKVRWVRKLPGDANWSGPVLAGGRLLVIGSNGALVSLSPQSGDQLSRLDLGEKLLIPPVVANGTAYFYTDNGKMIAMR